MIKDLDRSGYFGASDTKFIMRDNHQTKSWIEWWETKLGSNVNRVDNKYTRAGNIWEHPIIQSIDDGIETDGQIIIEDKLLRVNYDGYKDGVIYEIKTHHVDNEFKVTKDYYGQCQVEMYVYQEMSEKWFLPPFSKLYLVHYPLYDEDYYTFDPIVDPNRLSHDEIEYDPKFIKDYLRRLKKLTKALKERKYPG